MSMKVSTNVLESLYNLKYIHDYTDDGFVLTEVAGWVPVGDIIEYILKTEEGIREEEAGSPEN